MLTAVEYLRPVGLGATAPQLFRAQNGLIYVVKLQNNRLGNKVLVNEYLAAQVGKLMGLCFPPSDLITISSPVLQHRRLHAAKVVSGPHFASLYLDKTAYVIRRNLYLAINKQQLAGVILFDHLFHNIDRTYNRRNLLIRREPEGLRIYAIDNSHLFHSGRWTEASINELAGDLHVNHRRSYGILLKRFLSEQSFKPYVEAVRQIKNVELEQMIEEIPDDWLSRREKTVLLRHSLVRKDMVQDIATKLCSLIPNKHGSANVDQGK